MKHEVIGGSARFDWGFTQVLAEDGEDKDIGIGFSILRMRAGETQELGRGGERAVLLLTGKAELSCGDVRLHAVRASLFDENPSALHCPSDATIRVRAEAESELAVFEVANEAVFEPRAFGPADLVQVENRGEGLLGGTAHRIVRTVFDCRNRPEGNLVLGEVVNLPGRWSSYPPHHHPQPEIYHYRFTLPQGYGHAELGEKVHKVRQNDTLLIRDGQDHSQVSAPGYGMYYVWVIRHLPANPYRKPEFTAEHLWANDPDAPVWKPKVQGTS